MELLRGSTASPPEINYLLKGRVQRVPDPGDCNTLHPGARTYFAAAESCDSSKVSFKVFNMQELHFKKRGVGGILYVIIEKHARWLKSYLMVTG